MSKVKGPTKVVRRSSEDGKFVTKKFAETHKSTTEKQHVHVTPPKKPR